MQLAYRGRSKLYRGIVQWRDQPDIVHLHIETRLSLLRNLLDALRSQALRCATVRWRAAGHIRDRAMHRGNHSGAGSYAGDHPHCNQGERQQAQDPAMGEGCHFAESIQWKPGRK